MFRLIAIVLTSTFLLLGLFGTSSEEGTATRSARMMGVIGTLGAATMTMESPAQAPRPQYVIRHHQPMKAAPEPAARVLRILPYGATVDLIDTGGGDFVRVRDQAGEMGFVHADSLSDALPG